MFVRHAGLSEIAQSNLKLSIQQHVVRFQVAVQNAGTMSFNQRSADLASDPNGFVDALGSGRKADSQRTVFHVFHHVIRWLSVPANIQQPHDVP